MIPSPVLSGALKAAEHGLVPDPWLRFGIDRLCRSHARELSDEAESAVAELLASMEGADVAPVPDLANRQHYEVPAGFFVHVLGPRLKYSCCHFGPDTPDLAAAEEEALAFTRQRADLADGQRILELGCGWGSLTLSMAEACPGATITAVSNSGSQREFILGRARERGISNVTVLTRDMNAFTPDGPFDRVVSVEMFEHMRNWTTLLGRIESALAPGGRVFLHYFCHRRAGYEYGVEGPENWLGRHFFTGGIMPVRDLPERLDVPLRVEESWDWDGVHYEKTSRAWLERLDAARDAVLPILAATYGAGRERLWFHRWRLFFLACEGLFGHDHGREWGVRHCRLARPGEVA